jgi:hypothetical protein
VNDLQSKAAVRTGPANQALLDSAQHNKTLSFAGFAAGAVLAGVATALFVF